ncbi:antA/AntB antirepressor family protein [Entomobacter blattae]|uniref:AntA/AntB antirepressor n=1 Tax=Entomobacter blattae TaxID=2762277 RepID=A0A7H1NU47_9PROT|nr:antA/AntB antirepressor family protein [Entomobacter blattae]QNT79307.1 AntA/AntB antirepressor [Entomobacter blattae]
MNNVTQVTQNSNNSIPEQFQAVATFCTATEVVIGGRKVLGIADARDLHKGLGVGRDYSTWIDERITKYGFIEKEDYNILFPKMGEQKGSGGHNKKQYVISLDMAKELAMVENNEQGKLIRRYFIWAENQLRDQQHKVVSTDQLSDVLAKVALIEASVQASTRATVQLASGAINIEKELIHLQDSQIFERYLPMKNFLDDMGYGSFRRGNLVTLASGWCREFAFNTRAVYRLQRSRETGRWLFHHELLRLWFNFSGKRRIQDYMQHRIDQLVFLNLQERKKKRKKIA